MARRARKSRAGLERWKHFVECLRLMNFAFNNVRLYPPTHAEVTSVILRLHEGVSALLSEADDIGFGFMDEMLYIEGAMSIEETAQNEMLVARFQHCRVEYMTIGRGITREDLLKFFVAFNEESKRPEPGPPMEVVGKAGAAHIHIVEAEVDDTESKSKLARRKTLLDWYERACGVVKETTSQLFKGPEADLKPIYRLADELMAGVRTKGFAPLPLLARVGSAPDLHTRHAVNTAMLSCALGEMHGLNSGQLQTLCVAAFLHDLGRCIIPPEWAQNMAPLSPFERAVVHQHASWSLLLLARCPDIAMQVAVLGGHHHESPDRTHADGYAPDSFHRILHAADLYELALFSNKRYWRRHRPDRILRSLLRRRGKAVEPPLAKLLVRLVGYYSVGTVVELSDGRTGIVVRSNETHPGRPKVCILGEEGAPEANAPEGTELPPVVVDCLDPDPTGLSFARTVKSVLGDMDTPEAAAWMRRKKDYLVSYSV